MSFRLIDEYQRSSPKVGRQLSHDIEYNLVPSAELTEGLDNILGVNFVSTERY
jgi:hypothetical protein